MACPTHEQLSYLHDGELDATQARQLRAHLRECAVCAAQVRDLDRIDNAAMGRTPTARCLTAEELGELADGCADSGLRQRAERHARSCDFCKEAWDALDPARATQAAPAVRVRFSTPAWAFAWGFAAVAAALAIAAVCFRSHVGPQAPPPGVEIARTPAVIDSAEPPQPGPENTEVSETAPGNETPPVASDGGERPTAGESSPRPRAVLGGERGQPRARPRDTGPQAPGLQGPSQDEGLQGIQEKGFMPEGPMLALTGGSALVRKWQQAAGDDSRFSLDDLEELHRELPGDREVLEALVRRLKGEADRDPGIAERAREYERQLRIMAAELRSKQLAPAGSDPGPQIEIPDAPQEPQGGERQQAPEETGRPADGEPTPGPESQQ